MKGLLQVMEMMDEAMTEHFAAAVGKRKTGLDVPADEACKREPTELTAIDQATTALKFAQDNWMKQARLAQHLQDVLEERDDEICDLRRELAETYTDLANASPYRNE